MVPSCHEIRKKPGGFLGGTAMARETNPIAFMHGIFTYIYHKNQPFM